MHVEGKLIEIVKAVGADEQILVCAEQVVGGMPTEIFSGFAEEYLSAGEMRIFDELRVLATDKKQRNGENCILIAVYPWDYERASSKDRLSEEYPNE